MRATQVVAVPRGTQVAAVPPWRPGSGRPPVAADVSE